MSNSIIERFYTAFKEQNAAEMAACYHPDVIFNDPAFKNLNYQEVSAMWEMLIKRADGNLSIEHHSVMEDNELGQCTWEAEYEFSKTGNAVHNIIHATMQFKDGKIIRHDDHFNFWKWSKMALGLPGALLGWTPYLRGKVQKMARKSLDVYLKNNS